MSHVLLVTEEYMTSKTWLDGEDEEDDVWDVTKRFLLHGVAVI